MELVKFLIDRLELHRLIKEHEWELRNKSMQSNTVSGGAKFYETAVIHNLKRDPSKIQLGKNTHIRGELLVFPYGGEITIGDNCYVGENTRIWSGEKVTIGNDVLIAHNINLIDFAHETNYLERAKGFHDLTKNKHPSEKGNIPTAPIIIEDYVAIYPNTTIMRGVTIGKGAIISSGSMVMNNVKPFTVVGGNPSRAFWKIPE